MILGIITSILGVYCVFMGIKTILTGSLTINEEKRLEGFSKKGARIYKLLYAAMNIISGLIVISFGVLKILEEQKIIGDTLVYRIIILAVVVIMAIALVIAKMQCKKMSDDE